MVLTVKDNGIGIDPADQVRVFDKFQRASDPAVQGQSGTGIGLYLAKRVVQAHGGAMEFQNNSDGGTTVMLRLPAATNSVQGARN